MNELLTISIKVMQKTKHFLFMAAMLLCSFTASAHDFEVNGIYYQITSSSNLTVAVTYKGDNWNNYSEKDKYIGNISIPQYVTYDNVTYQVTSVADYAFYYCTKLTHIILPEGIADIGYMSFYRCDSLTSIIIPEGVVSLGSWAFGECANLKSVTLPSSLSEFGYYPVFQFCNSLDYIVCYAENPPTASGMAPFYGVDKSIPVYVPASSVSAYQSEECWSESTDVQPLAVVSGACGDNLTWQFTNYDGLLIIEGMGTMFDYDAWNNNAPWYEYKDLIREIVIDKGVTSIGECAFYECHRIYTVAIPESVTSIGNYAFIKSGIESVYIPKTVSSIGYGLFSGCNSLREVVVDKGNEVYDSREDCNAIIETNTNGLIAGCPSTVIPSMVTLIGPAAFCDLETIVAIDIPESVTGISHNAFRECNLSSIVIPRNVSSFGILAFADCNKLGSIICHAEEPPRCGGNPFYGVDKSIPVYVPASSVEAYQTATSWNEFTNIQPIPSNDIASGTCGDNLTWRLTEEYELIIEGEGAMYDYEERNVPWYNCRESIKTVTISEGVTSHKNCHSCSVVIGVWSHRTILFPFIVQGETQSRQADHCDQKGCCGSTEPSQTDYFSLFTD